MSLHVVDGMEILKHFRFSLPLITFLASLTLSGQADSLFFTNSLAWEEERYPDVQGEAYFFEDFVVADIQRRDSFVFKDVLVNFNGFTKQFEVLRGEEYIVLETLWYRTIHVDAAKNEGVESDVVFKSDLHPSLKGKFREVLYAGENMTLIHEFSVDKTEATKQIPGKTLVFERFVPVGSYYLIQGKQLTPLRPKKEVIAKLLGKEKDFFKFLKAQKIKKLNEKKNLAEAIGWYDKN